MDTVNDPQAETEAMVAEFNNTFEPPHDPAFWETLVREELSEVQEAVAHLLKELADLMYVSTGFKLSGGNPQALEGSFEDDLLALDPILGHISDDIMFEAFKRVHQSNMSKLMPDGSVKRREDGKVLKGPDYVEADMMPLVVR